jgi:hypothetical protein
MALFFVAHARGSGITSRCERLLRKVFFSLVEFPLGLKPGYIFSSHGTTEVVPWRKTVGKRVFFGNL